MAGMFFTSWELWQQMTFVLAMLIVAVFCAGLAKMWWNNRLLKKQEVLDVEKRARVGELRKTGLPTKRANPVPFGVRAIQSGVEVDGIWISRPTSLNETGEKLASSTALAGRDSDSQRKGQHHSEDERSVAVTTTSPGRATPRQSPSAVSIVQKLTDSESTDSAHSAARPVSHFAHKAQRQSSRPVGALNEDTLRRLEGRSPSKPHFETYVPTSFARQTPRRPGHQSSDASSAHSADSQPPSAESASGRSNTSSHSSKLYMAARHPPQPRTPSSGCTGQDSPALQRWSEKAGRDPFETPARTSSGFSAFSMSENHSSSFHQQGRLDLAAPEPTFGPGDMHLNRASRRVNDGFHVLPAGTFGGIPGERERGRNEEAELSGQV